MTVKGRDIAIGAISAAKRGARDAQIIMFDGVKYALVPVAHDML